jgi:phosphotransferase system enzyme I (PtsP)
VKTLTNTIEKISEKAFYFEQAEEQDDFLKESLQSIQLDTSAEMAAIFLYEKSSNELIFRAGIDTAGVWDRSKMSEDVPSFQVSEHEAGRAFTQNKVIRLDFEKSEEHPFSSKLILPLSLGPMNIGILILAHSEENFFKEYNDFDLTSAVRDLADILSNSSLFLQGNEELHIISGQKASTGIAFGYAIPFWAEKNLETILPAENKEAELSRFHQSVELAIEQLETLQNSSTLVISEMGNMIFSAHILMIKDHSFIQKMVDEIEAGATADAAITTVVNEYAQRFSEMSEQRFSEKAQDVRDLGYRLKNNLNSGKKRQFSYKGKIALARHIYPSDLLRLSMQGVSGIVLFGAGVTAHISILARSLDVPVLITDDPSLFAINDGTRLLLDAIKGKLYIEPTEDFVRERQSKVKKHVDPRIFTLKGKTRDNVFVQVAANVNILKDAEDAKKQGSEGIGLYRSEFPFILKNDFLTEEQQYHIYKKIAESQKGKEVIFRTADIGGDKLMQGRQDSEDNPFLGVRGIRFSLANRDMFRDQLRAMIRAGYQKQLGIMLPMVSSVEEVLEAKDEIKKIQDSLKSDGITFAEKLKIGAMIELPSAAMVVEEIARECDFLSIGTNDLTMYLLAVDRTNENLSHLYRSHHPAVLSVLQSIVKNSQGHSVEISVCGDAAADPVLIPFFIGIGIRKLSVSPFNIEPVKKRIAQFTLDEAKKIAGELLSINRIVEMDRYLKDFSIRYPEPV